MTHRQISRNLARLRRIRAEYGGPWAQQKLALLESLSAGRLERAKQVLDFHECLLFLRAYPDNAEIRSRAEQALAQFEQRADLRRHREELASTGIAGTAIDYPFFWPTAKWLVERFPGRLRINWEDFTEQQRLIERLPLLTLWCETPALDELDFEAEAWIALLKSPGETDGEFLVKRVEALAASEGAKESFWSELAVPLRLTEGAGGPSRTHAQWPVTECYYPDQPLSRMRPDVHHEVRIPPRSIREVSVQDGSRLIVLAREAMITRDRDLDAFMYGDPRDVRMIDCGDGLQLAAIGVKPDRRLLLESVYGFLTFKNGIPIGYVLTSALLGSAEVAYNVFETFRGAEAALIYVRVLAAVRALFQVDTFTVYPYQLGYENEEGLASGAWWFYQKLGFRARDAGVLRLMQRELKRIRANPAHRSSPATLTKLAAENVYFDLAEPRDDVIGVFPLTEVGLAIIRLLARRFGADRERATRELSDEVARLLETPPWSTLPVEERQACQRWAPLVACLDDVPGWSREERHALFDVMRAKGGRRESDFVTRFDSHSKLRAAFRRIQQSSSDT